MLGLSLLALSFASLSVASTKCKCLPGDACFPKKSEWDAFARTLSQPLIAGQLPLASACYNTSSNFSPAACDTAKANEFNVAFRVASTNAVQWTNYEALITNTSIEQCLFNPAPGDICHQGRVPVYAINATTVSDIQNTLKFAKTNNLRLVIKNTGHELMGRAFGVGAVELFMHNFQAINISETFVPVGAPKGTAGQFGITIEAGVEWFQVYAAVAARNRTVAGGFSVGGSVGAGAGWSLGGGHSILSPFYGLGVDNVLQYTVVLPNATQVTANSFTNPDLFWALRGGGGPSFGIVTSTTYLTHPSVPYTGAFYTATANSSSSYHTLLETWIKHHNAVADAGWGGVWPFLQNSLFLTLLTQGTPPTNPKANSTLEAFFSASRAIPGVTVSLAMSVPYKSFQEWNIDNLVNAPTDFGFDFTAGNQAGTNSALSSWLLPREVLDNNATALADIYVKIPVGLPWMVVGGAVSKVDPDATSVTPAFRSAISDFVISSGYNDTLNAPEVQALRQSITDQMQPLRDLAPIPSGGQYLNEPDILEKDWQHAYWGRHYPRLLSIKKQIDPSDLLIVRKGVNSEQWDDEILCKTV